MAFDFRCRTPCYKIRTKSTRVLRPAIPVRSFRVPHQRRGSRHVDPGRCSYSSRVCAFFQSPKPFLDQLLQQGCHISDFRLSAPRPTASRGFHFCSAPLGGPVVRKRVAPEPFRTERGSNIVDDGDVSRLVLEPPSHFPPCTSEWLSLSHATNPDHSHH